MSLIQPPPRPTLFPYTTLFRSKHKDQYKQQESRSIMYMIFDAAPTAADSAEIRQQLESLKGEFAASTDPRSEEHTSELQSLAYLVCRLLLEKKNSSARRAPLPG